MRIIQIKSLENGSHLNQEQEGTFASIPEGFAVVPEDMDTPNYPFGEIEVEEINGIMTVTKWTAGAIPDVEETAKTEVPITAMEQLRADVDYIAVMTGVEL